MTDKTSAGSSKECLHGQLIRGDTGPWYCASPDCGFTIWPQSTAPETPAVAATKDIGDLLMAITTLRQKTEDAEVLAKHVWDTATALKANAEPSCNPCTQWDEDGLCVTCGASYPEKRG